MKPMNIALLMLLTGCVGKKNSSIDVGAGSDAHSDSVVAVDAGTIDSDATVNANTDSNSIAAVDTGADSDIESDINGGSDTEEDAGEWFHCPDTTAYVGDTDWTHTLDVSPSATYCAVFRENQTLEEALAAKAKLRLVEGKYPISNAAGTFDFALPVCVIFSDGETAVTTSAGKLETSILSDEETKFAHRFAFAIGNDLHIYASMSYTATPGLTMETIELNGTQHSLFNDNRAIFLSLCDAGFSDCIDNPMFDTLRIFISCNPTEYTLEQSTFVFEGGEVRFDFRKGQRGAWAIGGTEPGALVHAAGELDGVSFSQRDYWKLIYSPLHHHIGFDFAVLFETPIGLACGIKVEAMYGEPVLHTVACDLENIETRIVDDYLLSIPQL